MSIRPRNRLGCLAALSLIAVPVVYACSLGWVRTIAPVAAPIASGNLIVELEAVDFKEGIGPWPIVATVDYPNVGPIRGAIRSRAGDRRSTQYRIRILSKRGVMREVECHPDYDDACYFDADLGQSDLTAGILVAVSDVRDGSVLVPTEQVHFIRSSRYSFALWDMLMSV